MTWQEIYQSKLTTAEEAIKLIHDGDKIVTGFACGEPIHIEKTLAAHYKEYKNLEIINMLTLVESPWAMQEFKGHIKLNTLFASKSTRASVNSGDSEFTTSHFYQIPVFSK